MRTQTITGAQLWLLVVIAGCGTVSGDGEDNVDAAPEFAQLSSLELVGVELSPPFDPSVTSYTAAASFFTDDAPVLAAAPADHFITVNGSAVDSGQPSDPVAFSLGANAIAIEVVSFGKETTTYTINATRGANTIDYVKASNTEMGDQLGFRVAISGDLLAVAAVAEQSSSVGINGDQNDNSASVAGAVYVYSRSGDSWVQEAYLKPAVIDVGDTFGLSLALDGDTLVVGSSGEDSAAVGVNGDANNNAAITAGAAWVFLRSSAGTWTQQAYLKASNTAAGDQFGAAVDVSGDTIAVGASGEDSAAVAVGGNQLDNAAGAAGAVYIFQRTGTVWAQQAYIKSTNTDAGDLFGRSVAIDGDTLVVGADLEDSPAVGVGGNQALNTEINAGAVYVYVRSGALWAPQAYLKASNTESSDVFGREVDLSGDILVVNAVGEDSGSQEVDGNQADNSAVSAGAAYVFVRNGSTWAQEAYLKASNSGPSDGFGVDVAIFGETIAVTADGEDSAAAGFDGNQADNEGTNAGAAYTFRRVDGAWRQTNFLKATMPNPGDSFGARCSVSSRRVVVGARFEASSATGVGGDDSNNDAPSAGAAYVFE